MIAYLSHLLGVDPTYVEAGCICFGVTIPVGIAAVIAMFVTESAHRELLESFTGFLGGGVGGTRRAPVFEGFYGDMNFTITTRESPFGPGYNRGAPTTDIGIKFFRESGLDLRVMKPGEYEFPLLAHLTFLKRVRTGDDGFDRAFLVHASDPGRALALLSNPEVKQALGALFDKLYYRRLYVRRGAVEALERHVRGDKSNYQKDNILLAVKSLNTIAKAPF